MSPEQTLRKDVKHSLVGCEIRLRIFPMACHICNSKCIWLKINDFLLWSVTKKIRTLYSPCFHLFTLVDRTDSKAADPKPPGWAGLSRYLPASRSPEARADQDSSPSCTNEPDQTTLAVISISKAALCASGNRRSWSWKKNPVADLKNGQKSHPEETWWSSWFGVRSCPWRRLRSPLKTRKQETSRESHDVQLERSLVKEVSPPKKPSTKVVLVGEWGNRGGPLGKAYK